MDNKLVNVIAEKVNGYDLRLNLMYNFLMSQSDWLYDRA